jgi:hypothetical protein
MGQSPSFYQDVFSGTDIDEVALDIVHMVLHQREHTDALAIIAEAIAGYHVRIAPHTASRAMARSQGFPVAIRPEFAPSAEVVGSVSHDTKGSGGKYNRRKVHIRGGDDSS